MYFSHYPRIIFPHFSFDFIFSTVYMVSERLLIAEGESIYLSRYHAPPHLTGDENAGNRGATP
jgi:hypothetical protein